MNPRRLCQLIATALLAVGLLLTTAARPANGQQEADVLPVNAVDATDYPSVVATVTAPAGLAGADLPVEAFKVAEGSVLREVTVERIPTDGLEVVLLIDTSGSMTGAPLDAAKTAAIEFLSFMPPQVRVSVMGFGAAPSSASGFTHDRGTSSFSIVGLRAFGETALYDALAAAASAFPAEAGKRAIVVLSDGGDTVSTIDLAGASQLITDSGARLHAIELVTQESNRAALATLAAAGGGEVVSANDPTALAGVYRDVAAALVNQYRLTWTSDGHDFTTVEITLAHETVRASGRAAVELPPAPIVFEMPSRLLGPSPDAWPPAVVLPEPQTVVEASRTALWIGAACVFAGLLLLALIALTVERRPRVNRSPLAAMVRSPITEGNGESRLDRARRWAADSMEGVLARRNRERAFSSALEAAGIAMRPGEFLIIVSAISLFLGLFTLLASPLLSLVLVALVIGGSRLMVSALASRRRSQFAEQLPDNLQLLTGSLRAGHGLLQSVDAVGREAASPSASEFRRVVVETRLGRDLTEAMRALAERMQSVDFEWVVQAVEIHRTVGGDLAEILDTVGATIRERRQLAKQVQVLTAEGRLSAYILLALPLVLAAMLRLLNPEYFSLLTHGAGLGAVAFAVVLMVIGSIWLRKLIRLEY